MLEPVNEPELQFSSKFRLIGKLLIGKVRLIGKLRLIGKVRLIVKVRLIAKVRLICKVRLIGGKVRLIGKRNSDLLRTEAPTGENCFCCSVIKLLLFRQWIILHFHPMDDMDPPLMLFECSSIPYLPF